MENGKRPSPFYYLRESTWKNDPAPFYRLNILLEFSPSASRIFSENVDISFDGKIMVVQRREGIKKGNYLYVILQIRNGFFQFIFTDLYNLRTVIVIEIQNFTQAILTIVFKIFEAIFYVTCKFENIGL